MGSFELQEQRKKAIEFSKRWENAKSEKSETQSFYHEFFGIFNIDVKKLAPFEYRLRMLKESGCPIFADFFWPKKLLIEQKSRGKNLNKAEKQAWKYLEYIDQDDLPEYIILSDFANFHLIEVKTQHKIVFKLKKLERFIEYFSFLTDEKKICFESSDPLTIKAAESLGDLHISLKNAGYKGNDLDSLMVRILFCFFSDDTGIFVKGTFKNLLHSSASNGKDLGDVLINLFDALSTETGKRQKYMNKVYDNFAYINGMLFNRSIQTPQFDSLMRKKVLYLCGFDWNKISPEIFGSLYQSTVDYKERKFNGIHYTSEENILKVIKPLFLDELHSEFAQIKSRRDNSKSKELKNFHKKISKLKFFDPACGCGNFLVVTYKEIRKLELNILKALLRDGQLGLDILQYVLVDVNQFYGIEINDFAANVAKVALWMIDHKMNRLVSKEFGKYYTRIPLKNSPNICIGDSILMDWKEIINPDECSFILGNPPFRGAKIKNLKKSERIESFTKYFVRGGNLDKVAIWFIKAALYIEKRPCKVGFVSTSSLAQGEQAIFWSALHKKYNCNIIFAHQSFPWKSDTKGKAQVHVIVVGLAHNDFSPKAKKLYCGSQKETFDHITPYLIGTNKPVLKNLAVNYCSRPETNIPRIVFGNQPIDNGIYIFSKKELDSLENQNPNIKRFFRPYIGAEELLNKKTRWILCPQQINKSDTRNYPILKVLISRVAEFRKKSSRPETRRLGEQPNEFAVKLFPEHSYVVFPEINIITRNYLPISRIEPPILPSNLLKVILDPEPWHLAVLSSKMHFVWFKNIGGRLGSSIRYSTGIVYNTFPWPAINNNQILKLEILANELQSLRLKYSSSLSDMYDSKLMPLELRKLHSVIDNEVEKIYTLKSFTNDAQRLEYLLCLYSKRFYIKENIEE